jgi:hypothetical protein
LLVERPELTVGRAPVTELQRRLDARQFLRQLPGAGGELVDEIDLLDQAADALGQRIKGGARGVLIGVALRQAAAVFARKSNRSVSSAARSGS